MKIVFCYQFCSMGGCETVLSTRMHELRSLGVDAHALFFDGGEGEHLFKGLGDRMRICRTRTEVEGMLAAVEPNYLISLDTPRIVQYLDQRPPNMKFVFEVHSTYPESLKRIRLLAKYQLSAILTPSQAQRNLVTSLMGSSLNCPIEVVPNPLRRNFGENRNSQASPRPIVLWVGRLDPHKNWRAFIEICREVHARNSASEYWVVGNSMTTATEKTRLWEEVKRAGLVARFRWLPHVQYDKMDRLYRFVAASGGCLVSTSQQESFGMAAAEAMACRCPVVVPDIGGFRDFVLHEETGFRYPLGHQPAAVQNILQMIEDLPLRQRIVTAGYERVQSSYSARSAVSKLIETLENLPRATD
jgi:glycosyltransferase involved in cell wall biosynthesis